MKIAILHRTVCHYQVDSLVRLHKRLADAGILLKIYCGILEESEAVIPDGVFEKLPYLKIGVTIGGLRDNLILLYTLIPSLRRYKPDLIVTEDICFMPNCLTVWAYSRVLKAPYLIRGLGVIPNKKASRIRWFLEPLISLFRNGAKAFLCYSGHAADYYSSRYHKPCYILCNSTLPPHTGPELEEIKTSITEKYAIRGVRIAFIGRLLPQKRVDLLLAAAAKLGCHVDIIGDGPARPAIGKLVSELEMGEQVRLHGQITDDARKKEILRKAHLGVLPGLGGLAIQEMMWHGLPVIASHADGTEKDLIVDGETGYFINEMNSESLAAAIGRFAGLSAREKASMAHKALSVIDDKYNVESMTSVYLKGIMENT